MRKSPCVPQVNKGKLLPHGAPRRVVDYLREYGPATSVEVHEAALPDLTIKQVREAISDLLKRQQLFAAGGVSEQRAGHWLRIYSAKPVVAQDPQKKTPTQRTQEHRRRKQMRVSSVFEWRGNLSGNAPSNF